MAGQLTGSSCEGAACGLASAESRLLQAPATCLIAPTPHSSQPTHPSRPAPARPAEGVDTAPALEGLIAQARPAHGSLAGPIRAAAAAVGGGEGGGGAAATLILRAVTEEQAAVLVESAAGREELQGCDVAAFLFDAAQPGAAPHGCWALGRASGGCSF